MSQAPLVLRRRTTRRPVTPSTVHPMVCQCPRCGVPEPSPRVIWSWVALITTIGAARLLLDATGYGSALSATLGVSR